MAFSAASTFSLSRAAVALRTAAYIGGPNTVTPSRFGIYGTDVGVMWDDGRTGYKHQLLTIFGGTFSGPNMTGVWGSYNVQLA